MISHICGVLEHIEKDRVVIDVNGVGYEIILSTSSRTGLPKIGGTIKFITYLNVKEDLMQLFGFSSREEKSLFLHLISVSGIGPKGAMNILSAFELNRLVIAITKGDIELLSSAQGIGKKTAQRLVVELKEKIAKAYCLETGEDLSLAAAENDFVKDAVSALITLGYSAREARQAVLNSGLDLKGSATIEDIIKKSLKTLS